MDTTKHSTDTIAQLVATHLKPEVLELKTPDGTAAQVLILPAELAPHSVKKLLEEFRDAPERRRGQADLTDIDSFIAHTKRFADEDSVIFVNGTDTAPSMLVVFDYHQPTKGDAKGSGSGARFCAHRGRYLFPLSEEWRAWKALNAKSMTQAEFAECIENRVSDIAPADSLGNLAKAFAQQTGTSYASVSKLVELSRGLTIRMNVKCTQHKTLQNGETQFFYQADHQDETGAPLKVPGAFLITIRVFKNDQPYQIPVRLRYRFKEGVVTWFFELYRADVVFEDAIRHACEKVQKETGLPLLYGAPES